MAKRKKEGQSALEFLTDYGWMIILIAIALVALYYLGVFNSFAFQSRGPPGDCTVYRAGGAGSLEDISLQGVCDGELPEFVGRFGFGGSSNIIQFGNSNDTIPSTHFMPEITNSVKSKFTMTAWIYSFVPEKAETAFTYGNFSVYGGSSWNAMYMNVNGTTSYSTFCNDGLATGFYNLQTCIYNKKVPEYTWMFVAMEDNGTNTIGYAVINGNVYVGTNHTQGYEGLQSTFIIYPAASTLVASPFNGIITNVQLYNNSLSQNSLYQLYDEGIAGSPIELQYIVGWWPLNGNLNDYSGNGNNGYAYNSADVAGAYDNNYTVP